jgi:hypothetical protein
MALPRKNGFFTASYADTGSIRAFIKLINNEQFEDIKKMIAPNADGPIGKKEILKFIGDGYNATNKLTLDQVNVTEHDGTFTFNKK